MCASICLPLSLRSPKPGYGMPSSHAQTLFYFLVVLLLVLHVHTVHDADRGGSRLRSRLHSVWLQWTLSLLLTAYTCAASLWRVHVHMHSLFQTFAGAAVGVIVGYWVHVHSATGTQWLVLVVSVLVEQDAPPAPGQGQGRGPVLVSMPVPLVLRALIILIGACVLYHKTLRRVLNKYILQ